MKKRLIKIDHCNSVLYLCSCGTYSHKLIMLIIKIDCNPFLRDQEPRDLYRNMDQIQMIDIQYYNQFMSVDYGENENDKVSKI